MILGNPWIWQMLKNSNTSISKPKLASMRRRTWQKDDKKTETCKMLDKQNYNNNNIENCNQDDKGEDGWW